MAEVMPTAAASPYVVRIAGESNEERGFDSYMDARRVFTDYKWKLKAANAGRVELLEGDNIRENFDASISPDAGKKAKKRSAPGGKAARARKEPKKAAVSWYDVHPGPPSDSEKLFFALHLVPRVGRGG